MKQIGESGKIFWRRCLNLQSLKGSGKKVNRTFLSRVNYVYKGFEVKHDTFGELCLSILRTQGKNKGESGSQTVRDGQGMCP